MIQDGFIIRRASNQAKVVCHRIVVDKHWDYDTVGIGDSMVEAVCRSYCKLHLNSQDVDIPEDIYNHIQEWYK